MHPAEIMTKKDSFFYYDLSKVKGKYNFVGKVAHYHNYYEIYYLSSGSGTIFIEGKSYNITPSEIIFLPPNVMHRVAYSTHERVRINLLFSTDYINPVLYQEFAHLWEEKIFSIKETNFISELFDKISRESLIENSISQELIRCYLTELLTYIHRISTKYNDLSAPSKNSPVQLAIEYITHNFNDNITLNELASLTNYSPNYFSKIFTDTVGIGYKKYILLVRLKEAEKMILGTNKSIKEIASLCGFNDSNRLSTLFKEVYGLSPVQYKKAVSYNVHN